MNATGTLGVEAFLQAFFGTGNDLDPSKPELTNHLAPWMARVRRGSERILLPRLSGNPATVTWYALCRSAQDARAFREDLLAAVGPSYTDFQGVAARLDPADPVDGAVLAFSGPQAFKLRVVDPDLRRPCNHALERMLRLHESRPSGRSNRLRSRGRVLMDFRLALRQRDFDAADAALVELREFGHLDAWNLIFLRIQRWEASEDWEAILEKLDEGSLIELRRPRQVTEALLRALYRRWLLDLERNFQPAAALAHFRRDIEPHYGGLLTSRAGMSSPEATAMFMLKAAAAGLGELRDAVLQSAPPDPKRMAWLEALAELVTPAPPHQPSADPALLALSQGDADRAFELLLQGAGGEFRVQLMLRCAVDIGTLQAAEFALEALYALPPERASLIRAQRVLGAMVDELEELCTAPSQNGEHSAPTAPADWLGWLQRLDQGDLDENQSLQTATHGAREWSRTDFAARPGDVRRFADLLQLGRSAQRAEQLRLAVPAMMEYFLPESGPLPAFLPVLRALTQHLAFEERRSGELLGTLAELVEATLRLGLDRDGYRELGAELCELVLLPDLSPEHIDWGLDLLEMLLTLAPPDPPSTQRVGMHMYDWIRAWGSRVSLRQRKLFNALSREFGLGLVVPAPSSSADQIGERSLSDLLSGKSLALYSLNEAAVDRVRSALRQECGTVQVTTFHDKAGGSPALLEAARSTDLFVIVTAAAKHAATNFIEDNRPKELATLRHHAQGSASLLRVVEEFVRARWT